MKLVKEICPPGKYNVNRLDGTTGEETFTPERLNRWVQNFRRMKASGLRVPAPFRHDPKMVATDGNLPDDDSRNNAGWWEELFVDSNGKLHGILDVPDNHPDKDKLGTTIQEVSPLVLSKWKDGAGREWDDAMVHIACVTHPVVPGQSNFKPLESSEPLASAMSFAMSSLVPGSQPNISDGPTGSLMDLIKKLRSLNPPIDLPNDTTPMNLAERLSVAVGAIVGSQRGENEGPTGNPTEQPTPIVMSNQPGATPKPEVPVSQPDPTVTALSAMICDSRKQDYRARVKALVDSGRITKAAADKELAPLIESFQLSLDPTTHKPLQAPIDTVLAVLEAQPEAGVRLNGQPLTARRNGRGAGGFRASQGIEEPLDPSLTAEPTGLIEDDAELDKSIEDQLKQAGLKC